MSRGKKNQQYQDQPYDQGCQQQYGGYQQGY